MHRNEKSRNYLQLQKLSRELGAELFGIADITEIKKDFLISQKVLDKFDKAICLGIRLSASILEEISSSPTRLYFHHYRMVNICLDQMALRLYNYIQQKGYSALPVPASQILDWQNQKAHLSHKKIGVLAGLGWIGRNNLLVNNKLGSQFRLVSVLTDIPASTDKPVKENCASCVACIQACPSNAISKDPADFEHIRCFEKLKEFQKQRLVDQYVCGVCVNACIGKK